MSCTSNIEKLSKLLRPMSEEQNANAAVALILRPLNDDFEVFLVKRVENPLDPWSGQMALPGGKRDDRESLKQTVIREISEETGINLPSCCRFLGVMKAQRSTPRPEMKILPFIVLLEHESSITLNKEELEEFAWISLKKLALNRGFTTLSFGESLAYIIGNKVIWGLTYRILEDFIQILKQCVCL